PGDERRTVDNGQVEAGIVQGGRKRRNKKPLPVCREEEACGAHDLISPGRTGGELAPASPLRRTGCCGFFGPNPSATLDKIPTRLSGGTIRGCVGECNPARRDFSAPQQNDTPFGRERSYRPALAERSRLNECDCTFLTTRTTNRWSRLPGA